MTVRCGWCGCEFEGRSNARYCSAPHRQAAFKARNRSPVAVDAEPAEEMVLVSREALEAIKGAVAAVQSRLEHARLIGGQPNWPMYFQVVADAVGGLS